MQVKLNALYFSTHDSLPSHSSHSVTNALSTVCYYLHFPYTFLSITQPLSVCLHVHKPLIKFYRLCTPNCLSLICGNKMPTRCNRGFYCRSYCLLNMFPASLCPSSGAQEYYTVVAACGILCCGFSGSWSGVELRVMCPVAGCCILQTGHITLSSTPDQLPEKPQHKIPHAATTV